jgi:hypothetical protein
MPSLADMHTVLLYPGTKPNVNVRALEADIATHNLRLSSSTLLVLDLLANLVHLKDIFFACLYLHFNDINLRFSLFGQLVEYLPVPLRLPTAINISSPTYLL